MCIYHALWVLLWILIDYGQSVTVKGEMCDIPMADKYLI